MYSLAKIQSIRICFLKQMVKPFGTNIIRHNISKQIKFMKKLISRNQSKRNPTDFSHSLTHPLSNRGPSLYTKRRMTVLNDLFMSHIVDLLSTGELDPELLNRNIEITHVKITPDFKVIDVFWIDNNINANSDTSDLLQNCASQIRHELSQLRLMSNVPRIRFVKDKNNLKELEEKFRIADYGEEHVPNVYPYAETHTVSSKTILNEKEETSGNENSQDTDNFSVTLPVMRHDIFDLDHFKIMSKIKASLNKSNRRAMKQNQKMQSDLLSPCKSSTENIPNFEKEQKEEFAKFLISKKKQKTCKNKRTDIKDHHIYDIDLNNDDDDDSEDY